MADGECEESPESAPSPGFAGAVVRGFDPRTTDDTTLRLYFDSSEGGRAQVANVGFSAHRDEAYVEYKNPPDLARVLSMAHELRGRRLAVESIDLLDVWEPHIVVKDVPEFVDADTLIQHFETATKEKVDSAKFMSSEVIVTFKEPKVCLRVVQMESTKVIFGSRLAVEVGYSLQEQSVLCVTNYPSFPLDMLKKALGHYFEKACYAVAQCEVIEDVAYVKFVDSSVPRRIVSQPPTAEFYPNCSLRFSTTPLSESPWKGQATEPSSSSPLQQQLEPAADPPVRFAIGGGSSALPSDEGTSSLSPRSWVTPSRSQEVLSRSSDRDSAPLLSTSPAKHWSQRSSGSEIAHSRSESNYADPSSSFDSYLGSSYPNVFEEELQASLAGDPPTRLLIDDFPPDTQAFVLKEYIQSLCPIGVECTVSVHETVALAKFKSAIDVNSVLSLSKIRTFPETRTVLTLTELELTDTILVSNLAGGTKDYLLNMYFENKGYQTAGAGVKMVDTQHALVTFHDCKSVLKVTNETQSHKVGDSVLTVEEYYPFMIICSPEVPSSLQLQPWSQSIADEMVHFLRNTLDTLKGELQAIKGEAAMETASDGKYLSVKPLEGAGEVPQWSEAVTAVVEKHYLRFKRISFPLTEHKIKIMEFALGPAKDEYSDVSTKVDTVNNVIVLSGTKSQVDDFHHRIIGICDAIKITSKETCFPKRHVRFLEELCGSDLQAVKPAVVEQLCSADTGVVTVQANAEGHRAFERTINELLGPSKLSEEMLRLSPGAYALLSSKSNLKRVLGTLAPHLAVELEKEQHNDGSVEHKVFFLSKDKKYCQQAIKAVRPFTLQRRFKISPQKIRVCKTQDWRSLVEAVSREFVVHVSVEESSQTVTLSGDQHQLEEIEKTVMTFLSKHTNVEELVHFDRKEWKVIHANFGGELKAMKKQAKSSSVKMEYSKSEAYECPVQIVGEPDHVDEVATEIGKLKSKVYKTEKRISDVPGLLHVLDLFEDKIDRLERDHKASIELTIGSGYTEPLEAVVPPQKVLTAVASSSGVQLSIYTGDFTQQQNGGTMLHFVAPNPSLKSEGTLKTLCDFAGEAMKEDFHQKLSQLTNLKPADIFQTKWGHLKCAELLHSILPEWSGGDHSEEDCLAESLSRAVRSIRRSDHLTILPVTTLPLQYPAKVFAKAVVKQVGSAGTSRIQEVSVFVEDLTHAKDFEELLKQSGDFKLQFNNISISASASKPAQKPRHASASNLGAVNTRSGVGSFITVKHGDMLDESAEVYVNSANPQLDLSQGQLSSKLLQLCGSGLQKECQQAAPLSPGAVAVTDARNLKCKFLFHVALPDYKTRGSEQVFRETIRNILQTAREKGIKSLAIPSLGAANLNYPADRSAQITFEEVMAFRSRYPSAVHSVCFAVYDPEVYRVYSQEYVKAMNTGRATPVQDPQLVSAVSGGPSTQLSVAQGDIADEDVDIIVNTTSEDMNLTSNAVSKAILRKAGDRLQKACRQAIDSGLNLCHGEIAATNSFGSLHCQKVLHAHVPPHSSTTDHSALIQDIVTKCLDKAESYGMKTISFPAFGIGQGGYSVPEAAVPMLKAFKKFGDSKPKSVQHIRVVILDEALYKQFCEHFSTFYGTSTARPSHFSLSSELETKFSGAKGSSGVCVELQLGTSQHKAASQPQLKALSQSITHPVAVFTIFSASVQTCKKVEHEIEAVIRSKIATDKLECVGFAQFLMEKETQELHNLKSVYGVEIEFSAQFIQISGVKESVHEVKVRAMEIIQKIEVAKATLQLFEWKGERSYPDDLSVKLERAKSEDMAVLEADVDSSRLVFNLQRMEEIHKATGKVCAITRLKKFEYPSTWEQQPIEDGKEKACHMFDVPRGSSEYKDAVKEFEQTIGASSYTIVAVQRVQCPLEYPKHVAVRSAMQGKHHKPPEVRRLFHGTKEDSIELIAVQGFNRVYAADANAAVYGKGVYFAVNARYSSQKQYAVPDGAGNQYMFVCSVLIGEYTRGSKTMKAAPVIPGTQHIQYDTLCDNDKRPTIFVAMVDAQAYPLYLITFRLNK